jgi:hypothetical protein
MSFMPVTGFFFNGINYWYGTSAASGGEGNRSPPPQKMRQNYLLPKRPQITEFLAGLNNFTQLAAQMQ